MLSWKSFSIPIINDWLKIGKSIYLAYGSEDMASYLCDLVPVFFIQENRKKLTLKKYVNLEHNFFEVDENNNIDYKKSHWENVMRSFINWTLELCHLL